MIFTVIAQEDQSESPDSLDKEAEKSSPYTITKSNSFRISEEEKESNERGGSALKGIESLLEELFEDEDRDDSENDHQYYRQEESSGSSSRSSSSKSAPQPSSKSKSYDVFEDDNDNGIDDRLEKSSTSSKSRRRK